MSGNYAVQAIHTRRLCLFGWACDIRQSFSLHFLDLFCHPLFLVILFDFFAILRVSQNFSDWQISILLYFFIIK